MSIVRLPIPVLLSSLVLTRNCLMLDTNVLPCRAENQGETRHHSSKSSTLSAQVQLELTAVSSAMRNDQCAVIASAISSMSRLASTPRTQHKETGETEPQEQQTLVKTW